MPVRCEQLTRIRGRRPKASEERTRGDSETARLIRTERCVSSRNRPRLSEVSMSSVNGQRQSPPARLVHACVVPQIEEILQWRDRQGSDGRPRQLHLSRRLARVGRTGSIARPGNGPETIGIEARSADECAVYLGEIEDGGGILRIDRATVEDPRAPRHTRANCGVHC
jgi:hypothetical protein